MKKVILAALAAMGMAPSGFAVTAQSGIYVGALGGWSFADKTDQDNAGLALFDDSGALIVKIPATDSSNNNYTYGITLGYNYAFTPNWLAGLEASYINFGYNSYDESYSDDEGNSFNGNTKLKSWGIQLMATCTYLMNNGFNVFGKIGAIHQKTTADNSLNYNLPSSGETGSLSGSQPYSKWLPAEAIGVGYMPIQNLNIALQYERTFGDDWNNNSILQSDDRNPITQNAITLGVTYNFAI